MPLLQSYEDKTFAANIHEIMRSLKQRDEKKELEKQIYAQLVVCEFYHRNELSYEDLKSKAKESADAYFETPKKEEKK